MATYDDYKAVQGVSANSGSTGRNANKGTGNAGGIIEMSPSDFIADVETTALRGLTDPEYNFFNGVFKAKDEQFITILVQTLGEDRYNKVKKRVSLKMGEELKARGVFPITEYFRPIDTR